MELARWIRLGDLKVDGAVAVPKLRLIGGERLHLVGEPRKLPDWHLAQPIELELLFEDEHLMIINKAAGLVVHPGTGQPDRTLMNALLHLRPELVALPRAGIVHRLDKDTSGLMVVAKTQPAYKGLVEALKQRCVERAYLAVVEGRLTGGFDIEQPLGRDPRVRTRQAVRADGRYALTYVRVQQRFIGHSLIEARLATGRTHQIRVHLAHAGYPLVGDMRYGARRLLPKGGAVELIECLQQFPRQALHAQRLGLTHPLTSEALLFETPPPSDFAGLCTLLSEHARE
jgi:23S rRNA pseudouridine1911/1915/1917 synthase